MTSEMVLTYVDHEYTVKQLTVETEMVMYLTTRFSILGILVLQVESFLSDILILNTKNIVLGIS